MNFFLCICGCDSLRKKNRSYLPLSTNDDYDDDDDDDDANDDDDDFENMMKEQQQSQRSEREIELRAIEGVS